MRKFLAILIFLSIGPSSAKAAPRIIFDPDFSAQINLSMMEREAVIQEVNLCLDRAIEILSQPRSVAYFKRMYKLDPVPLLRRSELMIILRAWPIPWNVPESERTIQVGGYCFGESIISINGQLLFYKERTKIRNYIAGVIVHEMAHWADFLDDGINHDGGLKEEEGYVAQKACGCDFRLPSPMKPVKEMVRDWRSK